MNTYCVHINIMRKYKFVQILVGLLFLIGVILVSRVFEYMLSEYIFRSHVYAKPCSTCFTNTNSRRIPDHIHQVFFFETSKELPKHLVEAQQTWIDRHPTFKYTLWSKAMINKLIDEDYPHIRYLYDSYNHWVKRADVARYLIIHKHGGWYLDLDIKCMHSLNEIRDEALAINKSVVVRNTEPVGFSNDFIGISSRHPFLDDIISSLPRSNRWYIFPYASTVISTGPMFFWGRFLNYPDKQEFHVLDDYSRWLHLMHGSSWHNWDGIIVWFFFKERGHNFLIFLFALLVTVAIRLLCRDISHRNNLYGQVYRHLEEHSKAKVATLNNNICLFYGYLTTFINPKDKQIRNGRIKTESQTLSQIL